MSSQEKVQKIDELRKQGYKVVEAAKEVGLNPTYYHQLKKKTKAKVGRPKGSRTKRKRAVKPVTLHIPETSNNRVVVLIGPDAATLAQILERVA